MPPLPCVLAADGAPSLLALLQQTPGAPTPLAPPVIPILWKPTLHILRGGNGADASINIDYRIRINYALT